VEGSLNGGAGRARDGSARASSRARALSGILLVLAAGCGGRPEPSAVETGAEVRRAWVGEDAERGLRVIAEPLPVPSADPAFAPYREEEILKQRLGLPEEEHLLRLHLLGPPAEIREPGGLRSPEGVWKALGAPPAGLSPDRRLLWITLGAGGSGTAPEAGLRSFLLRGARLPEGEEVEWERDGRRLRLEARSWTDRERRAFLDPAGARE